MKYSVVNSHASPPRVLLTYPFRWMAALMAEVYGGEKQGFDVAITPTKAQDVINICTHRDSLHGANMEANERLLMALTALMPLVARDDTGRWATVFDADMPVSDDINAILDKLTAFV